MGPKATTTKTAGPISGMFIVSFSLLVDKTRQDKTRQDKTRQETRPNKRQLYSCIDNEKTSITTEHIKEAKTTVVTDHE